MKRKVPRMFWVILITAVAGYLAAALTVFLLQRRLIYFPTREMLGNPAQCNLPFKDVALKTSDGLTLCAWYVPPPVADGPVVLHCHGNGGNISYHLGLIQILRNAGVGVLAFDYRGYGHSEGSPDEQGTYRDAQAAWDYLTKTVGIPPERIIVYGQSLGGGVASHLAVQVKPAGLILESTFTSLTDRGAESFWFLPVRLLARYHYPTIDRLASISCPVLIFHSPSDEVIPIRHGRALFEAAHEPKRFIELRGDHNNCFEISGDVYPRALRDFIHQCSPQRSP
ncbi:MAG: alpha/beta fold hydrolase [Planctomycetota bacterium]